MYQRKHTPGPWTMKSIEAEDYYGITIYGRSPHGVEVEIADVFLNDEPREELAANGVLLSKASELFDACTLALERLRVNPVDNADTIQHLESVLEVATKPLSDMELAAIEVR